MQHITETCVCHNREGKHSAIRSCHYAGSTTEKPTASLGSGTKLAATAGGKGQDHSAGRCGQTRYRNCCRTEDRSSEGRTLPPPFSAIRGGRSGQRRQPSRAAPPHRRGTDCASNNAANASSRHALEHT